MGQDLLHHILGHPTPERVMREARRQLAQEARDRAAFREWLEPHVKAEFINGQIIMHSPAKRRHNQATKSIAYLLETFATKHDVGEVAIEKALVELERNDVEPDVCFWLKATSDKFTDDMNVYPAPDLVVEVLSKSTGARDRGVKKDAYELDGVREYWIVDAKLQHVEQYLLTKVDEKSQSAYELRGTLSGDQTLRSEVLTGFFIPVDACFDRAARTKAIAAWK